MPLQQEDYFVRMIGELREFVTQAVGTRNPGKLDEALIAIVQAQEKLFGRPSSEFRFPDVNAQLAMLSQGETTAGARTKWLAYADILEQAGAVYQARGQRELAGSAFQLALYVHLILADRTSSGAGEKASIAALVERVPPEELHAPVLELLERFNGWN
ncbi:MAG: hypothetical protein ACREFX_03070 [Opitutaceae bacterium]